MPEKVVLRAPQHGDIIDRCTADEMRWSMRCHETTSLRESHACFADLAVLMYVQQFVVA
jgi:hypothetical protein